MDIACLGGSAFLAHWLRPQLGFTRVFPFQTFLGVFILCSSSFILLGSVLGLYRAAYHAPTNEQYMIGFKAYVLSVPIIFTLFYVLQLENFPRGFTFLFLLFVPFLFLLGRSLLSQINAIMQKAGFGTFNALIIGYNGVSEKIIETYDKIPQLGCRVKGIIEGRTKIKVKGHDGASVRVPRYRFDQLSDVISRRNISRILVPSVDDAAELPELLDICKEENIDLKIVSPEFDSMFRFSRVHDVAGIPLYSRRRNKTQGAKQFAKRVFDFAGAFIALLAAAPILLVAALAVYIEDGRPIFFRQRRALAEGKAEIEILKFRTMKKDAEDQQEEFFKQNKNSGGLFFIENDPRVTRVGKFLRKFSIDEIPQFFTVLSGQMSLVGPRPLALADLKNITPANRMRGYYELRADAKAGITGLWQISGRREVDFREMVLLDLYYIENHSIMFDIEILFATINVVLFGKGAH